VSFILNPAGDGDLLSGEELEVASAHLGGLEVNGARVAALLVNCTPRHVTLAALERMDRAAGERPLGAYANLGAPDPEHGWAWDPEATPAAYAAWALACRERSARILGGCCGTTPEHIGAVSRALYRPDRR
jgi:homocysteine S-methyltransferase